MRYPTIGAPQVMDIAEMLLRGSAVHVDDLCTWRGDGVSLDLRDLDAVVTAAEEDLRRLVQEQDPSTDREPFEGRLAAGIFHHLESVPPEVLDDKGFWRYLAVSRFWWFISWRESERLARGSIKPYLDVSQTAEQIPLRLYLRAKAVGGDVQLCQSIPKSTDFWRSHLIRVRTGSAPHLGRAFARMQTETRLPTEDLRGLARQLNRTWSNVVLVAYSAEEAAALIEELK